MKTNTGIGLIILGLALMTAACNGATGDQAGPASGGKAAGTKGAVLKTNSLEIDVSPYKAVFIELGSDRCIPCRQMQPIMKEVAAAFPEDLLVVFYDVWEDPAPARKYGIQLIPTQVFLDGSGKEFFRHVGLYPKEDVLEVLGKMGVKK